MLLLLLCPLFVACVKSQKSPLECDVRWFGFYYKLNDRTANMVHTHFAMISTRAGGEQEGEKVSLKRETPIDFRMTNWVERCGVVFCVVCNTKGSLSSRVEKLAHINTGFSQSSHNSFFPLLSIIHFYAFCCSLLYSLLLQFPFFLFSTHWLLTFHSSLQHSSLTSLWALLIFSRCCCEFCFFGSFSASFTPSIGAVYRLSCVWTFCLLAGQKLHIHTIRSFNTYTSHTFRGLRRGSRNTILSGR